MIKFLAYINGFRSGKDAHCIEKDAMKDPFLSDAIDGYDSVEGDHAASLLKMQQMIHTKTLAAKNSQFRFHWGHLVACFTGILAFSTYFLLSESKTKHFAQEKTNAISLNFYVPESYLEKRDSPLSDMANEIDGKKPTDELNIYIPKDYFKKRNIGNCEEIHLR